METLSDAGITILYGGSTDYFLGDAEERYFGNNYKKVHHIPEKVYVEDNTLHCEVVIQWPEIWARKKKEAIKPHAGTLDFFVISAQLVELYYSLIEGKETGETERMWISDFICSSGTKCIEEEKIHCNCRKKSEYPDGNNRKSLFEIKIADATVQLLIPERINQNAGRIPEKIQKDNLSFYEEGYKHFNREVTNILLNKKEKYASAEYELRNENGYFFKGSGQSFLPCLTFCDLVLISGQLSQILLFGLDGITRDEASNLWLRNIHGRYIKPIQGKTSVKVFLKHSSILTLRNEAYKSVQLRFDFNDGDLTADCKAAYKINTM